MSTRSEGRRFLSVCSGIEAASVASKRCAICGMQKPLDAFHRQRGAASGRHSYCKECYLPRYKGRTRRKPDPSLRREQNIRSRYGLSSEEISAMLAAQDGNCALCERRLARFCIDHDHATGRVRGLLCHRCNIVIGGWDDPEFRRRALAYMGGA